MGFLSRGIVLALAMVSWILVSLWLLKSVTAPWVGIGAAGTVLLLWLTWEWRRRPIAPWIFNLAVAVLALTGVEAYLQRNDAGLRYEGSLMPPTRSHDRFGYVMLADQTVSLAAFHHDAPVFAVTYTTNERGLREPASDESDGGTPCIVFFGGSFMFGAGVGDEETLAYRVARTTDGVFRVHNFSAGGYGPHQMLAAVEDGWASEVARCTSVAHGLYWAIPDHARRAAGRASWDPHGPRYVVGDDGRAHFRGHFDEGSPLRQRALNQLRKSATFERALGGGRPAGARDIELFTAIVRTARERFLHAHPGGRFHVLLWDDGASAGDAMRDALREAGIEPILATEILPGFPERAYTFPRDGHPTAEAHELLAAYLVDNVLARAMSLEADQSP